MKKDKNEVKILKCSECDEEIESCDYCAEYFEKEDIVFCSKKTLDEHFCVNCSDFEGKAV